MKKDTLLLNVHFLKKEMKMRGLTQKIVSCRIGVHRHTVARWLSGQVQCISKYNAKNLADFLQVEMKELISTEQQKQRELRISSLVNDYDLVRILRSSGAAPLAEELLLKQVSEDSSDEKKGYLYNKLASVYLWQQKANKGRQAFLRARNYGRSVSNKKIIHNSHYFEAMFYLDRDPIKALKILEKLVKNFELFESSFEYHEALIGLGGCYRKAVQFEKALSLFVQASIYFKKISSIIHIAWSLRAMIGLYIEMNSLDLASKQCREIQGLMKKKEENNPNFYYMKMLLGLSLCEIRLFRGLEINMKELPENPDNDFLIAMTLARICRLSKKNEKSRSHLLVCKKSLKARKYPLRFFAALLLQEEARFYRDQGEMSVALEKWMEANALYKKLNLHLRISKNIYEYNGLLEKH
jgi:transcriptional regulator with XRE-family HTH domain